MPDMPAQAMPMAVEDHPAKSDNIQRAKSVLGTRLTKDNASYTMAAQGDEALNISTKVKGLH
jgi:hypothetical protein